jgi:dTDP-glucose 4,6-dehydratase
LPVNIGNPAELTILQFAETINKMIGNKAGIEYKQGMFVGHDPQRRQPDITKAKKLLNWEPKVSLEEGLEKTIPYLSKMLAAK